MNRTKGILVFLITLISLSSNTVKAQSVDTMGMVLGRITYKGIVISAKEAKKLSLGQSPEAYTHFKHAGRVMQWNMVWAFVGGYGLGGGLALLVFDQEPIGFAGVGIGSGLLVITFSKKRKRRYEMYKTKGVIAYNASL